MLTAHYLGLQDYRHTLERMREFTHSRNRATEDELWILQHPGVFTQGQAGKAEHLLRATGIPLVKSDRGGQITYHGPGQLVAYPLLDLRRLNIGVRDLVTAIENSVVAFLSYYGLEAKGKPDAPGVYVEGKKIASLGLRVRKSCSFHGVAINIDMDMQPFDNINPCGFPGLEMTQLSEFINEDELSPMDAMGKNYAQCLAQELGLTLRE